MDKEVCSCGIFEAAFAAAREGSPEGTGDDDIVGRFGKDLFTATRDVGFGRGEVGGYLVEALLC